MFSTIVELLKEGFAGLPDHRCGGNRTTYQIQDAVLSAFSVFVMQSPSAQGTDGLTAIWRRARILKNKRFGTVAERQTQRT